MRSKKRSFLMSLTSLILCVAMLVGSTFAWFTDTVTSGTNQIIAGNLDVEVMHTNAYQTTPKSIAGEDKMFVDRDGKQIKWEPGVVSFENLSVANVGNLAFKYHISMNVTDYNAVKTTQDNLKQALKVKILTGENMLEGTIDRDTVMGLDWSSSQTIEDFRKEDGILYPAGTTKGTAALPSEDKFQLIVYWEPTENDDRWNLKNGLESTDDDPLFIDFGINVVATQLNFEEDSFDDSYDINSKLPKIPDKLNKKFATVDISTGIDESGNVVIKTIDGKEVTGNEEVEVKNKSNNTGIGKVKQDTVKSVVSAIVTQIGEDNIDKESDQNTVIYVDIKTTKEPTPEEAAYDISLSAVMTYTDENAQQKILEVSELSKQQLGGKTVVVTIELGAGLENVTVKHHDEPMQKLATVNPEDPETEGYHYNIVSGTLTIISGSFSPFTVNYTQPKKNYTYEQYDSYCHLAKADDGTEEKMPHIFEDDKCALCGYKAKIGKVQIHTYQNDDYVCITDAGMTNKDGEPVDKILNGAIEYDANTKTLKLMDDVSVGQIDFTCDNEGKGGAILDLNGHVLTGDSWTALDIYSKTVTDADPYGLEGYNLVINDSDPEAVHNGAIYFAGKDHYYTSTKGWKYEGYNWIPEGTSCSGRKIADYTIKGGIITNLSAGKYGSAGDPYDGGGLSTCGNTAVTFNGGTFAGINADGDVGAIAIGKRQADSNCKLYMNEGAAIVGCSGGIGAVRAYGSGYFELNGGKIDYCTGWETAHAVYTEEAASFVMKDGEITNCWSDDRRSSVINLMGSGESKLLGGTIKQCDAYAVIWNSDSKLVLDGVTIENCRAYDGEYGGFLIMEATFEGNPTLTIKGSTKISNNTTQTAPIADNVDSRVEILGGDFTKINDTRELLTSIDNGSFNGIKGGLFSDANKAFVAEHLAEGCQIVDNGDGTIMVQ